MAFMRYANASVIQPAVSEKGWSKVRKASVNPTRNLVAQASEILGKPFNPSDYLLTHCFPAGHMVLMADGTEKAIETIAVGDLVITHKGNVKPVTTLFSKQVDEDLTVIRAASVPEVACTGEHPFYVIREKDAWCRVYPSYQGQVKCTFGGKQVCEKNSCLTNGAVPDWVGARDVRVGDRTYTPTLHQTQVSDDLNPNRMRLLGYYIAEGRVDKGHNGRPHSIRFSIHEDEIPTLGAEIVRHMSLEFGISTHSVIQNRKRGDKGVTLAFYSHEHAPWFLHHAGCGSRAKKLSPEVVWSPVEWQRQLIGAWINGDGCYEGHRDSGNNGVRLATSSDDLASQAVVILDRMGVHSRLQRVQADGREYEGRWVKGFDGWHIEVPASYTPKLAGVVHWKVVGNTHKRLSTKGRYRYAASTLSTVESVEQRHFIGTVYNLSVQGDESYIVNRQAVHNCTIVASVDVDEVPNVKLGRVKHGSKTINRKFTDYYIKPLSTKFVNNNGDSWSREVLLASYPTFIGGHNFLEHVQIEEQSKGRIIDAVARDIGDSVYIDILVATDRKHTQLVWDIESGKLGTLSMGCFIAGTMVTMADGTRVPIEDVQPGDMVLTHKGRAREVLNKQIHGVENGHWNTRRIRAQGVPNEIVATDIHPFFVYRAAEVCACGCGEPLPDYAPPKSGLKHKYTTRRMSRRFKVGHDKRILNPNGSYSLDEYRERKARLDEITSPKMEEVKAADLKVGDFLCFPRAEVENATGGVTGGLARLLGYFLAEGSFLKYKGDPVEVQFNFAMSEKDTYVAEVVELLRREFPEANDPWTQDRPERDTCVVHISGREVTAWFHRHGGEYSHRKRMSDEAMSWPTEMHRHVVGAWLNGDGHLHSIHGNTSGTTTSYDLACQMHLLMARVGVYTRMECNIAGQSVEVRQVVNGGVVVRDKATGKFPAFTLVAGQTDSQPLSGYTDKVIDNPTFFSREFRVLDDVVMFPITSVEVDTYEGWVYDMEVEEDHSYVVEGVAVHNCSVEETICTKCGNVAVDETDLCDHIKYEKLNSFYDDSGNKRVVAELCGHKSLGGTCGVTFIEASWVATPAFTGAVLRNILEPAEMSPEMVRQIQAVLSTPPSEWSDEGQRKAASLAPAISPRVNVTAAGWDFGDEDGEGGEGGEGGDEAAPAKAPTEDKKQPIDQLVDEVYDAVRTRVKDRVDEDLRKKKDQPALNPENESTWENDTVIKEAAQKVLRKQAARHYRASVEALIHTASTDISFVEGLAVLNKSFGIELSMDLYRTALRVGSTTNHKSVRDYLEACRTASGRPFSPAESRALVRIGNLLTRLGSISTRPSEE